MREEKAEIDKKIKDVTQETLPETKKNGLEAPQELPQPYCSQPQSPFVQKILQNVDRYTFTHVPGNHLNKPFFISAPESAEPLAIFKEGGICHSDLFEEMIWHLAQAVGFEEIFVETFLASLKIEGKQRRGSLQPYLSNHTTFLTRKEGEYKVTICPIIDRTSLVKANLAVLFFGGSDVHGGNVLIEATTGKVRLFDNARSMHNGNMIVGDPDKGTTVAFRNDLIAIPMASQEPLSSEEKELIQCFLSKNIAHTEQVENILEKFSLAHPNIDKKIFDKQLVLTAFYERLQWLQEGYTTVKDDPEATLADFVIASHPRYRSIYLAQMMSFAKRAERGKIVNAATRIYANSNQTLSVYNQLGRSAVDFPSKMFTDLFNESATPPDVFKKMVTKFNTDTKIKSFFRTLCTALQNYPTCDEKKVKTFYQEKLFAILYPSANNTNQLLNSLFAKKNAPANTAAKPEKWLQATPHEVESFIKEWNELGKQDVRDNDKAMQAC